MKSIFDEEKLGKLTLGNRIIRSATWMATADEDGYVTDQVVETYRNLAKGQVGGIITGLTSVAPADAYLEGGLRLSDDSYIAGHRRITEAAHEYSSKVFLQAAMTSSVSADEAGRLHKRAIDDWTAGEIRQIVGWFGDAASRAEKAGYDGVQIHLAHFFFLSGFVSPLLNHRGDEYGGNAVNRARIAVEVLRDMRAKTSEDFCIIAKVNCNDGHPQGMNTHDFLTLGRELAKAGIDGIEVSANGTSVTGIRPGKNEAYFEDAAVALKQVVDVPAILVGGHRSIQNMNAVLNRSDIEFLSMSRPLVREPDLLVRWKAGDTVPAKCVSCNACYGTPGHECIFNLRRR